MAWAVGRFPETVHLLATAHVNADQPSRLGLSVDDLTGTCGVHDGVNKVETSDTMNHPLETTPKGFSTINCTKPPLKLYRATQEQTRTLMPKLMAIPNFADDEAAPFVHHIAQRLPTGE